MLFIPLVLSFVALSSALTLPRSTSSTPADWSHSLEPHNVYSTRYNALGCTHKKNQAFYHQCCQPLKANQSLSSRPAKCNPGNAHGNTQSSSSLSPSPVSHTPVVPPTPVVDIGDGDCDEKDEEDNGVESSSSQIVSSSSSSSYSAYRATSSTPSAPSVSTPSPSIVDDGCEEGDDEEPTIEPSSNRVASTPSPSSVPHVAPTPTPSLSSSSLVPSPTPPPSAATGDEGDLPYCDETGDDEGDDSGVVSSASIPSPTPSPSLHVSSSHSSSTHTSSTPPPPPPPQTSSTPPPPPHTSSPPPPPPPPPPSTTHTSTTAAPAEKATPAADSSDSGVNTGGFATYFYQNGNPGACGQYHSDNDLIAAMDQDRFGLGSVNSPLCGKKVEITNTQNGKTVTVTIEDDCPTCNNGNSIDLSVAAFERIADLSQGIVSISWRYVS